jgi:hypothetical protein
MGAIGWCLEPHDLAVSKLIAGREKDIDFLDTLIRARMVSLDTIRQRLTATPLATELRQIAESRLERWSKD